MGRLEIKSGDSVIASELDEYLVNTLESLIPGVNILKKKSEFFSPRLIVGRGASAEECVVDAKRQIDKIPESLNCYNEALLSPCYLVRSPWRYAREGDLHEISLRVGLHCYETQLFKS